MENLYLFLIAGIALLLLVYSIRQFIRLRQYKRLKLEISKIIDVNLNNPSDDFLLHQITSKIANLNEKFEAENYKKKNNYQILDTITEGVIVVSIDRSEIIKIDYANEYAKKLFTVENFTGRSIDEVVENHTLIDLILKSYKSQNDLKEELLFYSPERKYFMCNISKTDLAIEYRIVILTDITKEKNLEILKKEFLTIMSHELRTPLAVMNGYLETILMDDSLDENNKKMINIIEDETARLTRLVNDLLDLGRMEKMLTEPSNFKDVNLSKVTSKAYNFFKMLADEMGLTLETDIEDDVFLRCDEDRIMQILYNLLDNACKFTSMKEIGEKTVFLRLYVENHNVIFEVEDTGIGIPSKELEKIFDMFYRVDKSRTRQVSGFGLGLYIVKSIVEKHNGSVYLESEENNGSLFRIIFKGGK